MTSLKNINLNEFIKKEKMTNLKDKLKIMYESYVKHPIRNTILTGLGLATIVGTFGGNEGGFAPIYNKKAGTWGGINLGVYNEFAEDSRFYGISIGLIQIPKKGEGGKFAKNSFYGFQGGVINLSENLTGTQIGVINLSGNLKGSQIGLGNESENLTGVQVGVANKNQKGWSALIGFGNGEREQKLPL